jgi:hypothetical protein
MSLIGIDVLRGLFGKISAWTGSPIVTGFALTFVKQARGQRSDSEVRTHLQCANFAFGAPIERLTRLGAGLSD